jgi:hypothetical protein
MSVGIRLLIALSLLVSISPARAQDAGEKETGSIACTANGATTIWIHTGFVTRSRWLTYEVNCPGNWSVKKLDANGTVVEAGGCSTVTKGGTGSCMPDLGQNEQLLLVVQGGEDTGAGVSWTLGP